jgi:hypothetical protein
MTAPATTPATPATPAQTHGCARCGAPVALDVGLCERCNPLGLRDSASSQVHGTVILGLGAAIAALAIAGHLAVAGIGPFAARVTAVSAGTLPNSVVATVEVRNDGRSAGSATCHLSDPRDSALLNAALVYTPRIEPGATVTFTQDLAFGSLDRPLTISCNGP